MGKASRSLKYCLVRERLGKEGWGNFLVFFHMLKMAEFILSVRVLMGPKSYTMGTFLRERKQSHFEKFRDTDLGTLVALLSFP